VLVNTKAQTTAAKPYFYSLFSPVTDVSLSATKKTGNVCEIVKQPNFFFQGAYIAKSWGVSSPSTFKTGWANRSTFSCKFNSITTSGGGFVIFRVYNGNSDRLKIQQTHTGTPTCSFFYTEYDTTTQTTADKGISLGSIGTFPAEWQVELYEPVVLATTAFGVQRVYFDWKVSLNGTVQAESLTGATRNYNQAIFELTDFCNGSEVSIGATAESFTLEIDDVLINVNSSCP